MSGLQPPSAQKPPPSRPPLRNTIIWLALVAAIFAIWMWQPKETTESRPEIDYSTAYQWVNAGRVSEAVLDGQLLEAELSEPVDHDGKSIERFESVIPADDEALVGLLREKNVTLRIARDTGESMGWRVVIGLLPWVILIGFWLWMFKRSARMMGGGAGPLAQLGRKARRYEKTTSVDVSFADVAGLAAAKRDLREVVDFLREPDRFARLGSKIPRGVLLVGPPGTGKTLLARAVAGEADVPFFSISGSEFIEMFVGVGAARVRDLFEEARKAQPSIVFIDELDAVGRVRGTGLGGGNDEREQTLNQLLSEMDGFDRSALVMVMAATNRPDVLDPALLRPGRFDRRVLVDLPEAKAREAILEVHLAGKPTAEDLAIADLAAMTPGFSGADLANLVNEAALNATRRDAERIHWVDCVAAYDKIVLGDPREGPLLPIEKKRVAVHEAGHALVAALCRDAEPPRRISILPRGRALGATHQVRAEDRNLQTRSELYARLQVLLAGYAAERMMLGDISTGAENDLREATRLASKMVAHYGMSDELGPVYYEHQEEHAFLGQRIGTESGTSDATIHTIEREARTLLGRALADAGGTLESHRAMLRRLIDTLLEVETLERDQLEALLSGGPIAHARAAS